MWYNTINCRLPHIHANKTFKMKNLFFILLLFCNTSLTSQEVQTFSFKRNYNFKRAIVPCALSMIAGGAWGLHEKTAHHWPQFHKRFPKANPQFWNPEISWTNKYENWPLDKRRSSVPVVFTDAKHLLASLNQSSLICAGITVGIGEKKPFWHYAIDLGLSFASYSIGNYITFNALYLHTK